MSTSHPRISISLPCISPSSVPSTSNMRNVDPLLSGRYEHVEATRLLRASSNWCDYAVHFCHSFRGRFTNVLAYTKQLISHQLAADINARIFAVIREVV